MIVPSCVDKNSPFAQLSREACRVVSVDRQAAAFLRAIDCKRPDYDVTAGLDRSLHARDIGGPVSRISQKMEGCPIMPNVADLRRVPFGYVCDDPLYSACSFTKPRLGGLKRGLRKV